MRDFDELVESEIENIEGDAELLMRVIDNLSPDDQLMFAEAIAALATEIVLDRQADAAEYKAECRSDR